MSKDKKTTISVLGTSISIISQQEDDFISLTDMLKAKDFVVSAFAEIQCLDLTGFPPARE